MARQSQEELQVQKALANLDQRRGTLLEQQLGIEREVTAVVRKRTEYQSKSNQTIQLRKGAAAEVQKQVAAMRVLDKSQANTVFNTRLQLALANQLVPAVTRATEEYNEQVAAQKRLNSLLEQGNRIRQSYKADRDRAKKGSGGPGLGENLALGVGFPLLFGGGAGSVLGSAAGSFVGSGFGGQILGGAIGQSIDQYVQSLGELGAALNPATADTDKLVEALGATGTPFEKLVSDLEDAGRGAEALALASDRMAILVGQDGVNALKEFGADSTELSNEFARAMTVMAAGVAQLINAAGIFKGIADGIERFNLRPQIRRTLDEGGPDAEALQQTLGGINPDTGRREITAETYELQRKLNAAAEEEVKIRERAAAALTEQAIETESNLAKAQNLLEISRIAGGLEVEKVYELRLQGIELERNEAINANLLKLYDGQITRLQAIRNQIAINANAEAARNNLAKDRQTAIDRINKVGRSGGGVDKEAQTQKAIAAQLTKQFELETKLATIGVTKLDKINTELERLDQRRALKVAELELSKEDERIKAIKLENLNKETEILRQQLELQRERAQIEQQMTALKGEQQLAGLQRGLDQELAGLTLPTGDVFGDQRNQLALEQQQRYANVMADVNDQIEQQTLLATSSDAAIAEAATKKLSLLERQKTVYENMLPAIAQAEQQQLKFNQTLSLVEGPVNAFVNGLTQGLQGIIDGTMSAEEAFAKMLKGMADALIQTAATMIAQYIAIGIARAFAGMGTGTATAPAAPNGTQVFGGQLINTGISAAADGGPAFTNRPMIVGERGPELFIPGANGRIATNTESRAALDRYTPNTNYNYNSQLSVTTGPVMQMENDQYIKREDFERGLRQASADGAKRGEAMTLKRLKNSRSTRSTLGM